MARLTKAELEKALADTQQQLLAEREERNKATLDRNTIKQQRDEYRGQNWQSAQAVAAAHARNERLAERLATAEQKAREATSESQTLKRQVETAVLRERIARLERENAHLRDEATIQALRAQLREARRP